MYKNSQSSMQFIEYKKENNPILNQIYNILIELRNKNKQIILCKITVNIGIKRNERTNKAIKQAIYMLRITKIPYTILYRLLPGHQKR